jgi:DNA repair ATPase RecN
MKGLYFKKIDLHVHTPASNCYSDKSITPKKFVNEVLKKGLDAIAITDHNTGLWIDKIKEAAKGTSLIIFPGVEITSASGIHILAIFDIQKGTADIQGLLGLINIPVQEQGKDNALCKLSHDQIVEKIKSLGALVILPHIDDYKGAFNELIGNPRTRFFNESSYDAVETLTGKFPIDFNSARGFKRYPTIIQSSDNPNPSDNKKHDVKGTGVKYTYFKMDEHINLEGLRQCFYDPIVRIKLMTQQTSFLYPRILSIKASDGFMKNQNIQFHSGLNSIIGGKGVGKSLIVEFIRFALDQNSTNKEIKEDHKSKLDKKLGYDNYIEIEILLESSAKYKIKRVFNENSTIECIDMENGEKYNGDIKKLFPILAYSQTEVIKISENNFAQLELIDNFIDKSIEEKNIDSLIKSLHDNDIQFGKCLKSNEEIENIQKEIATIDGQLKEINKQLSPNKQAEKIFHTYKFYEDKKEFLETQQTTFSELTVEIKDFFDTITDLSFDDIPQQLKDDVLINRNFNKIRSFYLTLKNQIERLHQESLSLETNINDNFEKYQVKFNKEYSKYKSLQHDEDKKKKIIKEHKNLSEQRAALNRKLQMTKQASKKTTEIKSAREKMIKNLTASYESIYTKRFEIYKTLTENSKNRIKLSIEHAKNIDKYFSMLTKLLGGSGIRKNHIESIATNIFPQNLVSWVLSKDVEQISSSGDVSRNIAEKIIMALLSTDDYSDLLNLEYNCFPDDIPKIEYQVDKANFSPLHELSVGQKCTALLIIALSEGRCPVIIDQPEDALDITTVWEDISKKLRSLKEERQFILTTHNSSVAVSSDSDMFVVVRSNIRQANVKCLGGIDTDIAKDEVVKHLEGGIEPYSLRRYKYNLKG